MAHVTGKWLLHMYHMKNYKPLSKRQTRETMTKEIQRPIREDIQVANKCVENTSLAFREGNLNDEINLLARLQVV